VTADVLVVGGGLEGVMATLAAARQGMTVRLLAPDADRFRRHDGLIDVLGYPGGESEQPVTDPFDRLPELSDEHPYSRVGSDAIHDALALFDEVTGDRYYGAGTPRNALVVTAGGRLKPTSRYPAGVAAGLASRERPVLLVGFDRMTAFDAPLVADQLDDILPYDVDGVSVEFPADYDYPPSLQYARALDDTFEGIDSEGNEGEDYEWGHVVGDRAETTDGGGRITGHAIPEALTEDIGEHLDVQPRVGFPAVLGRHAHDEIREQLQTELGARVFEIPIGPPSLPGLRLESHLRDALVEAGVHVESGTIEGFESSDGHIETVRATVEEGGDDPTTYDVSEVVLATGGLDAGGLVGDRESVTEPVFGCHVRQSTDRDEWTAGDPIASHPVARFGVTVNDGLQILTAAGDPEYDNLRTAGPILGGGDFVAEHSWDGVAIATGYAAGLRAAERV